MTEGEQKAYDSLVNQMEAMQADFRLIAEYAEALRSVTGWSMDGCQEALIVDLTLHKIIDLAERNFK